MRFASLGASNAASYASAGKATSDSAARMFAVQRKTGPDYTGLSKVAMKTASNEKVAAMNAEAKKVINYYTSPRNVPPVDFERRLAEDDT